MLFVLVSLFYSEENIEGGRMRIYLAHPISGTSFSTTARYFLKTAKVLRKMGYKVLHPLTGKKELRCELELKAEGYRHPVATNHAIVRRDKWSVEHSDVFFLNLENATDISVGCVAELAWAYAKNIHSVVVLPKQSKMRHAFVLEMSDVIFETTSEALKYLRRLIKQRL